MNLNLTDADLQHKAHELSKLPDTNTAAPVTVLFVLSLIRELQERRKQQAAR